MTAPGCGTRRVVHVSADFPAPGLAGAAALLLAVFGSVIASRAVAQGAAPADGARAGAASQLAIPINLRCTTCDDFIRCTPTSPSSADPVIVYRLKEKTFWAQIATIGDYFIQWLRPKTTDQRPLARYVGEPRDRRIETDESWRAQIDGPAALITLPDSRIDQRDGIWTDLRGAPRGACRAMKRRDGFAMVREFLGRPLPVKR
jgi:hypothetical protein